MVNGQYEYSVIGIPQGGHLSLLLENIMLNGLDREMDARGLKCIRYTDDYIIMVGSKQAAE